MIVPARVSVAMGFCKTLQGVAFAGPGGRRQELGMVRGIGADGDWIAKSGHGEASPFGFDSLENCYVEGGSVVR